MFSAPSGLMSSCHSLTEKTHPSLADGAGSRQQPNHRPAEVIITVPGWTEDRQTDSWGLMAGGKCNSVHRVEKPMEQTARADT